MDTVEQLGQSFIQVHTGKCLGRFNYTSTQYLCRSNYVRLGVCLPPNAEFELKRFNPHVFGISNWTRVSTLADLDKDTTGKKYFYHADSG